VRRRCSRRQALDGGRTEAHSAAAKSEHSVVAAAAPSHSYSGSVSRMARPTERKMTPKMTRSAAPLERAAWMAA